MKLVKIEIAILVLLIAAWALMRSESGGAQLQQKELQVIAEGGNTAIELATFQLQDNLRVKKDADRSFSASKEVVKRQKLDLQLEVATSLADDFMKRTTALRNEIVGTAASASNGLPTKDLQVYAMAYVNYFKKLKEGSAAVEPSLEKPLGNEISGEASAKALSAKFLEGQSVALTLANMGRMASNVLTAERQAIEQIAQKVGYFNTSELKPRLAIVPERNQLKVGDTYTARLKVLGEIELPYNKSFAVNEVDAKKQNDGSFTYQVSPEGRGEQPLKGRVTVYSKNGTKTILGNDKVEVNR